MYNAYEKRNKKKLQKVKTIKIKVGGVEKKNECVWFVSIYPLLRVEYY